MDYYALTGKNGILLDFDGTICLLFKNYNLQNTVTELCDCMRKLCISYSSTQDSFEVFEEIIRQTENDNLLRSKALREANRIITNAEIEAIHTCEPVRGAIEVLDFLLEKRMPLGISTNNSVRCVECFFEKYLPGKTIPIVGRVAECLHLMKPNPWSINEVCKRLMILPQQALYIGDTKRDYEAARNAGCLFWGMGTTERKWNRLLSFSPADSIVNDFFTLRDRLILSNIFH